MKVLPKKRFLLPSKIVFIITLLVILLTILSVWVYGLGKHATVIENSFKSTTILSLSFFIFITIGLYFGVKLKDTMGDLSRFFTIKKFSDFKKENSKKDKSWLCFDFDLDFDLDGDGEADLVGFILTLLIWGLASVVISYLFFCFGAILWFSLLTFAGMLYWVFFRALRLIFKKAPVCQGNLVKSFLYGLSYTVLYNFWIYGVLFLVLYYRN